MVNPGAYIVSVAKKTTLYRLEAGEIAFILNTYQAVHSNTFSYFADLPVLVSCLWHQSWAS